jgi:hypothetical protein
LFFIRFSFGLCPAIVPDADEDISGQSILSPKTEAHADVTKRMNAARTARTSR